MPVVEIRSLPPRDPGKIPAMLREAAVEGAKAFNIPPEKVWATFEEIPTRWYAEGDKVSISPGEGTHPPLVLIRAIRGRTVEMKEAFNRAVCQAIAKGLDVSPENVWIHFVEMEKTEVWHALKFHG
jgi:phenylpyruvate tautomerase PptA (4-oxalocrotonate tautomerase family)